ncbi:MAG TPA: host attachment protein [Xanthomonadales bacterium]|nr:host attachment protein [Xanthomonadales bacterium]
MNKTPSIYWVLVADSGTARILEMRKRPAELREVQELVSDSQHLTDKDLRADASGRSLRRQSASGHALHPHANAHDLAEQAFCDRVVKVLELAAGRYEFDQLVVIADPKTLGRLRKLMSKALAARVELELGRDLVKMPLHSLAEKVRGELGWPTG